MAESRVNEAGNYTKPSMRKSLPFLMAARFAAVVRLYSELLIALIAFSGKYRSPVASLPCVEGLPDLVRQFCAVQRRKDF